MGLLRAACWALFLTSASAAPFSGVFFDGDATGNGTEQLQLLDIARRSLGEDPSGVADAEIQTMPMLCENTAPPPPPRPTTTARFLGRSLTDCLRILDSGAEDGLLEGPTWGACAPSPDEPSPSPARHCYFICPSCSG